MVSRRTVFLTSLTATAVSFFTLAVIHTRRDADAKLEALRSEVRNEIGRERSGVEKDRRDVARERRADVLPASTMGEVARRDTKTAADISARARMVDEIK